MAIKVILLVVFFATMIGIGIYSRNKAKNVNDYVLGGRTVGPWISAFLLFIRCIHRICRSVRLEVWSCIYMDWTWKCIHRKSSCMAHTWTSYKTYDSAAGCQNYAGIFRQEIQF